MMKMQARDQKCICCNFTTVSTSFSFVITYYIFQKQIKAQTAPYFTKNEEQVARFIKNEVQAASFAR
jgi:hypothetical protein